MESSRQLRILLTGGGTGGHLFPAIATAEAFKKRFPATQVLFVGTKRKLDGASLARYGYASESIVSHGLKGKNIRALIKAVVTLPLSLVQAVQIIRRFSPDLIFGVGGYVTGPVVAAGRLLGIPTVIHEQNSIPGLANRQLGKIAQLVCVSLPPPAGTFAAEKMVTTGNPVRQAIVELAEGTRARVAEEQKTLLVLGGSQGAVAVNRLLCQALVWLKGRDQLSFKVIHQTGERDYEEVRKFYLEHDLQGRVEPFFSDMGQVYAQADMLVSRAGATTLAELAVLGLPAILIPYPYAADNHQEVNADYYVAGGGALKMLQGDTTAGQLAEELRALLAHDERLQVMGQAMRNLGRPRAAEAIVDSCLQLLANN